MMYVGGIGHALSICLDSCDIGVWLGTYGVAALMSCTSRCVFCCISRNFAFGGKVHCPPYGPWDHVPPHVWTDKSNSAATQDEVEDEAGLCALCCQTHSTITVCGECNSRSIARQQGLSVNPRQLDHHTTCPTPRNRCTTVQTVVCRHSPSGLPGALLLYDPS